MIHHEEFVKTDDGQVQLSWEAHDGKAVLSEFRASHATISLPLLLATHRGITPDDR